MKSNFKLKTLAALMAPCLAIPAQAQIEEVLVTATKRTISAQSVPISMTALSANRLTMARIEGVRDLALLTPGLNMNGRSNVWIPYIRGIGAQDTSGGQETSVSVYIDGVYISTPHGGQQNFNSVDRVEILKGPQGTLFGRNATGGLIHVITRDPGDELEIFGTVGYGDYDTVNAKLYIGGPLTDNLSADIAIMYRDQGEGYGDNLFTGDEIAADGDEGYRTKWIWQATENIRATWTADYQNHDTGLGDNRNLLPGSIGPMGETGAPGYRDVTMNFPTAVIDPVTGAVMESGIPLPNGETDGYIENQGTALKLQFDLGWGEFMSLTAYREMEQYNIFDNDGHPVSYVEATQEYNTTETFTQEFQLLSTGEGNLDWIIGAFYLDDDSGYTGPHGLGIWGVQVLGVAGPLVSFQDPINTESIAGFIEGTYSFTDRTRLTLGARLTKDEKQVGGSQILYGFGPDPIVTPIETFNSLDPGAPIKESWTEPTYKVVIQHDFMDDAMVYASFNHGFRSGSFNTVGVTGVPVEPETNDAWEIGIKSQWWDNRLRLNAAAYFTDFEDLQVVISRGGSTDLLNAGTAEIKGIEIDGEASVSDNVTFRFGLSLIDAEYTEFATGPNCSIRDAAGHTLPAPEDCNLSGFTMVRTPDTTFNFGVLFRQPVSFGHIGFNLDYLWTDDFFWEIDNRLVEPSVGIVNGSLFWTSPDDRWGITVWARNLTNEKYSIFTVNQAQPGPFAAVSPFGIGDQYSAAPPVVWGVDFDFKL